MGENRALCRTLGKRREGYDAAKWLRTHVEQAEKAADYTSRKVNTDLVAFESSLDSNRRAFQDIQTEAAARPLPPNHTHRVPKHCSPW